MADEENKAEGTEAGEGESKGGGMKMMLVIAALMLIEGGAVAFLVKSMGGPSSVEATELTGLEGTGEEAPVEVELITDRFQNMQTGRVWEWRVSVSLRLRQKNLDEVTAIQERDAATIKEGVALIFRRAHDRHLREPGMETIKQQLTVYLNEVFGLDADGLPRIERVIIPECKGFPADG